MVRRMRTVAFIPVRGGSKSIPSKNIKLLAGRPLLHWTLAAALAAREVDEVYVSSDSREILRVAQELGPRVKVLLRASALATDTASTDAALLDFAQQFDFERVVLIQATSPLTGQHDFDGALRKLDEHSLDSLLSVTHEHRFRWRKLGEEVEPENYKPEARPRRQDWTGEFMENGAFYITSRAQLLLSGCRLNGRVGYWKMPSYTAFEIDSPDDWEVLEALAKRELGIAPALRPRDIRLLISDVDGVLTDGGMFYGPAGEALKKFNTRDGMGIALLRESGREIAIVTGEDSPAVMKRAEKLKIDKLHLGIKDKLPVVRKVAAEQGIGLEQVAYIGDDINDLEALGAVGLAACPRDAHEKVRAICEVSTIARGGEGCVRELIDMILEMPVSGEEKG